MRLHCTSAGTSCYYLHLISLDREIVVLTLFQMLPSMSGHAVLVYVPNLPDVPQKTGLGHNLCLAPKTVFSLYLVVHKCIDDLRVNRYRSLVIL